MSSCRSSNIRSCIPRSTIPNVLIFWPWISTGRLGAMSSYSCRYIKIVIPSPITSSRIIETWSETTLISGWSNLLCTRSTRTSTDSLARIVPRFCRCIDTYSGSNSCTTFWSSILTSYRTATTSIREHWRCTRDPIFFIGFSTTC